MDRLVCPFCNNKSAIRFGRYKWKQLYYCRDCRKKFMDVGLKDKSYKPAVITNAITYYNLGNTLEESTKLVNKRFKVKASKSIVHSWVKEFSDICLYQKIRPAVVKNFREEIIFSHNFRHNGLSYSFKYHKPKLEILCRYPGLADYLKNLDSKCPDKIFNENQRCSQLPINIEISRKEDYNHACKLAGLALRACRRNRERHSSVEEFMLINDSCTVACEVPVWFWEKNLNTGICGHIDLLQLRQNKIFILDFKPEASREDVSKVASQLYLYASGLSFRTAIPLSEFRCAWFDDKVYCDFNPAESKVRIKGSKPVNREVTTKSWIQSTNQILEK